jgi:hypothetical protein
VVEIAKCNEVGKQYVSRLVRLAFLQGAACGAVCQSWYAALSVPMPKISIPPSEFSAWHTGALTPPSALICSTDRNGEPRHAAALKGK